MPNVPWTILIAAAIVGVVWEVVRLFRASPPSDVNARGLIRDGAIEAVLEHLRSTSRVRRTIAVKRVKRRIRKGAYEERHHGPLAAGIADVLERIDEPRRDTELLDALAQLDRLRAVALFTGGRWLHPDDPSVLNVVRAIRSTGIAVDQRLLLPIVAHARHELADERWARVHAEVLPMLAERPSKAVVDEIRRGLRSSDAVHQGSAAWAWLTMWGLPHPTRLAEAIDEPHVDPTDAEQAVAALRDLASYATRLHLLEYFRCSSANHWLEALALAREIGADTLADRVERAAAAFDRPGPFVELVARLGPSGVALDPASRPAHLGYPLGTWTKQGWTKRAEALFESGFPSTDHAQRIAQVNHLSSSTQEMVRDLTADWTLADDHLMPRLAEWMIAHGDRIRSREEVLDVLAARPRKRRRDMLPDPDDLRWW